MLVLGCDGFHTVRIPDDDVSIRAHCYPALTWVQVEDFGSVGRCDCHKLVFIHLPNSLRDQKYLLKSKGSKPNTRCTDFLCAHHSLVPDKNHSLLHSIGSLWDEGEVIFAYCLLGSAVRTVSAAYHLEVPTV